VLPPIDTSRILALRAQILQQSQALAAASSSPVAAPATGQRFDTAMSDALKAVSAVQDEANAASAAFERGDSQDLASVMIARQKASIAFEATLQVRNKLLGAYKDVMSMPL
jgi:flagellar hook-basal body complex protein FliE